MRRRSGPFGIRRKLSLLEYEASGRCRAVMRIQRSLRELDVLLQKIEKKNDRRK